MRRLGSSKGLIRNRQARGSTPRAGSREIEGFAEKAKPFFVAVAIGVVKMLLADMQGESLGKINLDQRVNYHGREVAMRGDGHSGAPYAHHRAAVASGPPRFVHRHSETRLIPPQGGDFGRPAAFLRPRWDHLPDRLATIVFSGRLPVLLSRVLSPNPGSKKTGSTSAPNIRLHP